MPTLLAQNSKRMDIADIGSSYYVAINSLSPQEVHAQTGVTVDNTGQSVVHSPPFFAVYAPVLIFFAVFITVFGMLIAGKIRDIGRIAGMLVFAFLLACTPYAVSRLNQSIGSRTHAGPDEIPRNVKIVPLSKTAVSISWTTDADKIGAIRVGTPPFIPQQAKVIYANGGIIEKDHTVTLGSLRPGQTYLVEIFSGTIWYANQGQPLSFTIPIR